MAIFKFVTSEITICIIMRFAVFVILLFCIARCTTSDLPDQVGNEIDSIITKWVPDQREALFFHTVEVLKGNSLIIKGETNIKEAKEEIIGILEKTDYEIYDSLLVLPDTTVTKKTWGLVTVSVCNIKREPSYSSELVSQALMGTPVKILKTKGGWLLIQTPDYYLGWTTGGSIVKMDEEELDDWKLSDRLIYQGKSGEIVSEDDLTGVVSDITSGAIVKLISERKDFYVVELPDGRRGCVNRSQAEHYNNWSSGIKPEPESMIKFAKSFLGYPYLWGGMSTKALDCSGFVRTIFFRYGIILARDASLQFYHGESVDISSSFDNLLPCDLVFFGHFNDKGEKRVTHVGLYIGDTDYINSAGMVKINSLDSTRSNYSKRIIMGTRRVIGAESQKGIESVKDHPWYNK